MTNLPEDARHIAFYLPSLRGGGAERVMVTLANGFAERGHCVDLVIAKAQGPYLAEVAPGVRVIDLKRNRVLTSLFSLARYLRRERPEAMLSALSHANIIAILARKVARVSMRLTVSEHSAPSHSLSGKGVAALLRALIRALYPQTDAVICVSNGARQELCELFDLHSELVHCVYNPLDVERIQSMMNQRVALDELPQDGIPIILAAGRLTAAKDYPNLLAAFAKLRDQRAAKLVILGVGEEEDSLKALSRTLGLDDEVVFAGFQENPFAWMRACDLYVLSSRWEGLPGALLEALACGVRVVSTDCRTGPNEILEDGKWGRLVPVNDPETLAQAMAAALDDPNPPDVAQRAEDFRRHRAITRYENIMLSLERTQD